MKSLFHLKLFALLLLAAACAKDKGERPVIMLKGSNPAVTGVGYPFTDAGATASDMEDGDLSSSIIVTGQVNTSCPDTASLTYNVTDSDGNKAIPVSRTVIVRYF